jgi:hypothetical protein
MANTYTQIYVHLVFAVKRRTRLISKEWRVDLFKYMHGIIENKNQKTMIINGVEDHVHLLLGLRPDCNLSGLVRDIKSGSSKWINENQSVPKTFEWQSGFGAFSVSARHIKNVINYIKDQESHHEQKTFRSEYVEFLNENEIDFRSEYIFD